MIHEENWMTFDKDKDGVLTELQYRGNVVKIVETSFVEEAVRILDTSGLTDVKYVATIGAPMVARLEKAGTLTPFMFAVQLLAVMLIDAYDLPIDN
jgi:hypothetical protein